MLCAAVRCIGDPPARVLRIKQSTGLFYLLSCAFRKRDSLHPQKGFLASAQILPQRRCLWNPPPFKKGGRKLICYLIFERGAGRAALRRRNVSGYASYRRKTCEMRRNRGTTNSLIFECACYAVFGQPEVYTDTRAAGQKLQSACNRIPKIHLIFECGAGRAALRRRSVSGYASYRRKTCEICRNRKSGAVVPQSEIRCGSHR